MRLKSAPLRVAVFSSFVLSVGMLSIGCPPEPSGVGKVTTMFTGDSQSVANALIGAIVTKDGPVDVADIESLTIKITEINLDYSGDAGEMEDGENDDGTSKINVFEGCEIVDLVQLEGVNRLISLDEAPAGKYTKIRISYEDPVLVLKSDPSTEITDIHITANGRLFISQMFDLPEGQQSILLIDFGGVHLAMNGNGGFVLTPQLAVELGVGVVEDTTVMGMITAIDSANELLTLMIEGGELTVDYLNAVVFLPEDTDTPTGMKSDLMVDQKVEVMGMLFPDDILEASSVRILPEPEPEPEPMP